MKEKKICGGDFDLCSSPSESPKMQLFRLTVKYLLQQNIFNFFFFHLKKNVNPGGSDLFPGCYTPKFFNRHIFIQRNNFFYFKNTFP